MKDLSGGSTPRTAQHWLEDPSRLLRFVQDDVPKFHSFVEDIDLMNTPQQMETWRVFEQLQAGDRVELKHEVKVGFTTWETTTTGQVVKCERRRHGLHYDRNFDDKAFSDLIVLRRDDGELTTVTLDEFTVLRQIDG